MAGGSEGGPSSCKKPRSEAAEPPPGGDPSRPLPDDALENVFRRIAPRWVAACRSVCRAWRDVVDARRLLREDLLPLKLGGIFFAVIGHDYPDFLARPSTTTPPALSGWPDSLPKMDLWLDIEDHCNGLLLSDEMVVHPATRWWAPVPSRSWGPTENYHDYEVLHLAYDPTISPHYKVIALPCFSYQSEISFRASQQPTCWSLYYGDIEDKYDPATEQSEWPPSLYTLHVFSSCTQQWKEKSFVREGEIVGTIGSMRLEHPSHWMHDYTVYWRGALYIFCQSDYVMRILLSSDKYHVIRAPIVQSKYQALHLGKSTKGVYFASLDQQCCLQVWRLKAASAQMEWILIHHKRMVPCRNYDQGSWIFQGINYHGDLDNSDPNKTSEILEEAKLEWNSDDEDDLTSKEHRPMSIIGFHPYKEVIFLCESSTRVVAYHLNGSKVQHLGNIRPSEYNDPNSIRVSFPYTPCWM